MERGAAQRLDKIDGAAADEVEADFVNNERHAILDGGGIVALDAVGQAEAVLEACAAAPVDGEAEDRRLTLALGDPGHAGGRGGRECDLGGMRSFAHAPEIRWQPPRHKL